MAISSLNNLSPRHRTLAIVGLGVAIFLVLAALYWVIRPDYKVLFSGLKPQDAAAIVEQLEASKTPYRIDDDGATVLVRNDDLYRTRLKVLGDNVALKGTVGFELFNSSDLGLTEFSQRVNFQRALQGELARTIMSLSEIDTARVHLAIAEASIFRKTSSRSKASVAIALKPGKDIDPASIRGIQRLVAAAVPDLTADEVVVVNELGTSLSLPLYAEAVAADARLQAKLKLEQLYADKVLNALEPIVGRRKVSVTVDVMLDAGGPDAGVEKIRRLAIAAVLQEPHSAAEAKEMEALISTAAGLVPGRGDLVTVLARRQADRGDPTALPTKPDTSTNAASPSFDLPPALGEAPAPLALLGLFLLLLLLFVAIRAFRPKRLTPSQREHFVSRLKHMAQEDGSP